MHFDDIPIGIIEKDLIPSRHGPIAPVGIRDGLGVETRLERSKIIGAIGDMPMADRVDHLARVKARQRILLRQMCLDRAIGDKGNIAGVALLFLKRWQTLGF